MRVQGAGSGFRYSGDGFRGRGRRFSEVFSIRVKCSKVFGIRVKGSIEGYRYSGPGFSVFG